MNPIVDLVNRWKNSKRSFLFAATLVAIVNGSLSQTSPAPGGRLSNLIAWLRSENGVDAAEDGEGVTRWNNSYPNPIYHLKYISFMTPYNNKRVTSSPPSFEIDHGNLLNFHPTILFQDVNGEPPQRLYIPEVEKPSFPLKAQAIQGSTVYFIGRPNGDFKEFWAGVKLSRHETFTTAPLVVYRNGKIHFWSNKSGDDIRPFGSNLTWANNEIAFVKMTVSASSTARVAYSKNGGASEELNRVTVNGYYQVLGNFGLLNNVTDAFGNIAETIIYDSPTLSDADNTKIQSYLALKYGITLDQSTAQSYVNSKGDTVWNALMNTGYNSDIFGVGRDDRSAFDQHISKSINSGTILTLALDNHFVVPNLDAKRTTEHKDNLAFFVIGNNGGNLSFSTKKIISNYLTPIKRIWRAQDSGGVGCLNYQFDLSNQSSLRENQEWYAVVADDEKFTTNVEYRKLRLSSDMATVKINLNDNTSNNFITLARLDKGSLDVAALATETKKAVGISTIEGAWLPKGGTYLELNSNSKGFVVTRLDGTGSIDAPIEGMLLFDTVDDTFKVYDGENWRETNPNSKFCE